MQAGQGVAEQIVGWILYMYLMSVVHAIIFLAGAIILIPVCLIRRASYPRLAGRFLLFNVCLLLSGSFVNGVWSCLVWNNLYFSTDYVFDFTPFCPILPRVIEQGFGQYESGWINYDLNIWYLNVVWASYALVAWAAAVLAYRAITRRRAVGYLEGSCGTPQGER